MAGYSSGVGYSEWRRADCVFVKCRGFIPQASRVQYGAPEPPENRDHYEKLAYIVIVGKGADDVLVWVHEDFEPVRFTPFQHLYRIIHKLDVVYPPRTLF